MKNLKQDLKQYYIQHFSRQQTVYLRGQIFSLLLIIISNVQSISIQLTNRLLDFLETNNINQTQDVSVVNNYAQITHYFRIYPLLSSIFGKYSENQILYAFIVFATTLNTYVLINQVLRFFLFKYQLIDTNFAKFSDVINSFILKIYVFIFYFPFNTASFKIMFNSDSSSPEVGLAAYCLILTLFISFMQNLHDFSFSFVLEDYMASTDTHSKQLELVLNLILVILFSCSNSLNQNVIAAFHIIFVLSKISLQLYELVYYDNLIIQTNLLFKFLHIFNSIAFCLSYNLPHIFNGTQLILIMLILVPFSYILAKFLLFHRISSLSLKQPAYSSLQQINLHIRTAYFMVKHLDMHDYSDLKRSVLYESIYENHYDTCTRKDCFCEQMLREKGFSWEELQGYKYRDKFIGLYFTQMYSEYLNQVQKSRSLKKREYNYVCFNYLTFLIEVVNVPTSALVEVVQIENYQRKQSSIKDQMIFQSIYDHGEKIFYNFFHNPTIYNQKLQLNKVIEFDQLFLSTQKSLKNCLLFLREMLLTLCQEYVDIIKLNKQVRKISKLKQETYLQMKKMYYYHPYSKRCQQLAYIYSESLDLSKRKPQHYQKQAILMRRKFTNGYGNIESSIPIFSQDACVIYISLLQPIGIIKNASFTTRQIFGYTPSELINKNCNVLIPDQLKQIHDNILNKFVTSGQLNGINAGQLQIFGIKQNGFAIPLNMRLKLDQTQANDFGASAFFTYQNNQSSEFIVFSTGGKLCNMTRKIYYQLFQKVIPENSLKQSQKLDLFKVLPILDVYIQQLLNKDQTLSLEHNSILISPQNEKSYKIMSVQSNSTFNSVNDFFSLAQRLNSHDYKFYSVSFRVGKLQTSYKKFALGFVQIERLQLMRHKSDIKEHLRNLSKEIEKIRQYFEVEQDFQNQNSTNTNELFLQQPPKMLNSLDILIHKSQINDTKPKTKLQKQSQVQRHSFVSHKSIFNNKENQQNNENNGSDENHNDAINVTKLTESNQNEITVAQYQNTNRKLINNLQEKLHINVDVKSDQSFDQNLNAISTPIMSTKHHHNFLFETKGLMSNEAIFEAQEQEEIQIGHSDLFEYIFNSKSDQGDSIQDSQQIQELNEVQNSKEQKNIQSNQIIQNNIERTFINNVKINRIKPDEQTLSNTPQEQNSEFWKSKEHTNRQSKTMVGTKRESNHQFNQASSVSSGMSEYHTLKSILLTAVSKTHQSKTMKLLYMTGFFKISLLIIFVSVLYILQYNKFQQTKILNQNLVKGYEIMNSFVSIIAHTEYIKMYNKAIIENSLTTQEYQAMKEQPLVLQNQFKQSVSNFENQDQNTLYGIYLRTQFQSIIVFNQRNISSTLTEKKIYSLVAMAQNLYMYSQTMTEVFLRYIHYNQKDILQTFQEMADLQQEEMNDQINTMNQFLITQIVLLEIFTFLMAFQVIPIYYYIQYKKEQILKLFCTFQPNLLKERIKQCEYFVNQDILQGHASQTVINKENSQMKKRTTSSTNDLQKMNIALIFLASLLFGFFSLYPITNFVITDNFISKFQYSSNELTHIYSFRGKAPIILAFNFLRQTATYEQRPQSLLDGLDQQLNDTYQYIQTTTNKIINLLKDESNQNNIYDKALHKDIVETAMNDNLCGPLQKYSLIYVDELNQIDLSDCNTILNGIWNNGYLLGLQSMISILSDFQLIYSVSQTTDKFLASLANLYKKDNGVQFIKMFQYIRIVPLMIGNFIVSEANQYYNQYTSYLLGIFIFVLILASITFLVLWNKYYNYLANHIYETRQIYGLFSYEFIHENPFISNYVKKEYSL
ncbi:hypothetical protein ABPG74_017614 [Tetrahymena malaccensis]